MTGPPGETRQPWEPSEPWQVIQRAPAIWDVVRMRGDAWDACCGFPLGGLARDVCSALNKAERAVLTVEERGRLNGTIDALRDQLRNTQALLAEWQRNAELAALAKAGA